ncbi:hypothetical protein ACFLU5_12995 [Bacteroidota bacterium]
MDKLRKIGIILLAVLIMPYTGCEESDDAGDSLIPENFIVDIPDALSYNSANGRISEDEINGGLVYALLGVYIYFGEASALLVQEFITFLRTHPGLTKLDTFTFTSDEDGRTKKATVEENGTYDGKSYQYKLTVWDEDETMAFQLFWNKSPISGVAIMSPYNIDRTNEYVNPELMYRLEYSEDNANYEKVMIVSVSKHELFDEDGIDNFKMHVGKQGDIVEIFGNSNHPTITIIGNNYNGARNYAFVGRADEANDIGVAQVAMPPSSVVTNEGIFENYSIRKVLEEEVFIAFGTSLPSILDPFLVNSDPPGYFVKGKGFEGSGDNVPDDTGFTEEFIDLSNLKPYVPNSIQYMSVDFADD